MSDERENIIEMLEKQLEKSIKALESQIEEDIFGTGKRLESSVWLGHHDHYKMRTKPTRKYDHWDVS